MHMLGWVGRGGGDIVDFYVTDVQGIHVNAHFKPIAYYVAWRWHWPERGHAVCIVHTSSDTCIIQRFTLQLLARWRDELALMLCLRCCWRNSEFPPHISSKCCSLKLIHGVGVPRLIMITSQLSLLYPRPTFRKACRFEQLHLSAHATRHNREGSMYIGP